MFTNTEEPQPPGFTCKTCGTSSSSSSSQLLCRAAFNVGVPSKYIHILNPTVREDIVHPLTAVTNCQICVRLKKAAERTKSRGCLFKVVDTHRGYL